jgi:hypothetical protein
LSVPYLFLEKLVFRGFIMFFISWARELLNPTFLKN